MTPHDESHERILEASFTETINSEDAATLANLEQTCAACRAQIEKLRGAREAMEREGDLVRAEMAEACRQRTTSDEQAVAATIQSQLDASQLSEVVGPGMGNRSNPLANALPWILAAAAAIVALLFVFKSDDKEEDPLIMGSGVKLRAPAGDGADFTRFVWEGPSNFSYRVRVFHFDADPSADPDLESRLLDADHWTPTASQVAGLPDVIRWELQAFDASGTELRFTERIPRASRK